uniref:Putative clathrin assembly protein n=1 Tax=Noccaea caerulescens TaxID=107243 RepID=A0A1J3D699_NOCCA
MRLDLSAKFRQVLGHAKDHASIGRAIVQNYNEKGFFDIEVAVVRATSHDDCPVDDKTMHEILFLVSNTPGAIPFLAEQISRRLAKTRDCLVAGKTLFLIHRLLRGSSRCIEQQLHIAHTSGHLQIGCCWFMMSQDHPSFAFLQNYVAYLEERVGWIINQAGKLEPVMSGGTKFSRYKEKSMDLVFHILPKCQEFIAKVLKCSPVDDWPIDNLVQAATGNILKESFQVYMTYSDGIAALVSMLFDLSRPARDLACEMLRKASQQIQDLRVLYEKCRGFAGMKSLDYPSVQAITMDHILALEECSTYNTPPGSVLKSSGGKRDFSVSSDLRDPISREDREQEKHCDGFSSTSLFSFPVETKISMVWVVFDDEDGEESDNPTEKAYEC